MKELSLEEAALAWAQRKRVEAMWPPRDAWGLVTPIGGGGGLWSPEVFARTDCVFKFRLAPEPPAKKFRPYTRSEIEKHLGVGVQHKDRGYSAIIIAVLEEAVHIGMWNYTLDELLENFTWSDGSPCGVEVDA